MSAPPAAVAALRILGGAFDVFLLLDARHRDGSVGDDFLWSGHGRGDDGGHGSTHSDIKWEFVSVRQGVGLCGDEVIRYL